LFPYLLHLEQLWHQQLPRISTRSSSWTWKVKLLRPVPIAEMALVRPSSMWSS
jgi:hypothetical protein